MSNQRILIVDDDLRNIRLIATILQEAGLDFSYASSAKEGLRLLRQEEYDLLLLDIMMPELDGYEFMEIIRKFRLFRYMPIILITAKNAQEDIVRGFQMGAQDYILKPFNRHELLARVNNMLLLKSQSDALKASSTSLEEQVGIRTRELTQKVDQLRVVQDMTKIRFMVLNPETWILTDIDFMKEHQSGKSPVMEFSFDTWLKFIHPDDRILVRRDIRTDLVGKRKHIDRTVRFTDQRDGSVLWIRIVGEMSKSAGEPVYITLQDMTSDVIIRQRIENTQRMESLGQLAAGVAHDFNNLLTAILTSTEILEKSDVIPDDYHPFVDTIKQACDQATDLTKQILDFGKVGENRFEKISLKENIEKILPILRSSLPRNISFSSNFEQCDWDTVYVDGNKLNQAVLNLIVNARDAIADEGSISLSLTNKVYHHEHGCSICSEKMVGEFVALEVKDTGIGIPEEKMRQIFEPFYTTKQRDNGTGLGLAQVYGIITQSKGHMQVESTVGQGSSFTVLLPYVENAINILPEEQEIRQGQGESILLIEDSDTTRQTIDLLLTTMGYKIISAASGEEGVDILKSHLDSIDMVISDIVMPGKNGDWVFEQVRNMDPDLPIVFMSASPVNGAAMLSRVSENYKLYTKPLRRNDWSRIITDELHQKKDNERGA